MPVAPQLPPSSSRPPITGYKVFHNGTESVTEKGTNDTEANVGFMAPGVYLFTVLAYNVLGDGKESNVAVTGW